MTLVWLKQSKVFPLLCSEVEHTEKEMGQVLQSPSALFAAKLQTSLNNMQRLMQLLNSLKFNPHTYHLQSLWSISLESSTIQHLEKPKT